MDIIRTRARLTDITVLAISTAASLSVPARGSVGDMADIGADAVDTGAAVVTEAVVTEAGDLTADAASAVAEQ